ncbi:MAG: radical SAM protein [Desulfotomaculaceae bacterium]|nr:radical SAM protein [Desulfotomaculaceae bacterium]MDD4767040.1 radical SAM protein [Desulfotomaculaceae bacterium]
MYRLVFAGNDGRLYDHHSLRATGRTGDRFVELAGDDLEKLPAGASLVLVPGGKPVGITSSGRFTLLKNNPWQKGPVWAVGALLPQGFTRVLLPAYSRDKSDKPLPLFGYTAVACRDGELYAAARSTDDPRRWDPAFYDTGELPALVKEKLERYPVNRILRQLAHCSLDYHCYTAQNIFYGRWEGGIPVSPSCNSDCLGCISLQISECCPSPQTRINFTPTPEEVAEAAIPHLQRDGGSIISFGQGCEGEPSLAARTLVQSIEKIREVTGLGTINMNSNAGHKENIATICRAGLDAIRVSMISAREDTYNAYHRPSDFGLSDVRQSIKYATARGVCTSLNLLVFPGLTDREEEFAAILNLVRDTGINMIQLRNLNIDPEHLLRCLPAGSGNIIGIPEMIESLREVPSLAVGNFSRPVR